MQERVESMRGAVARLGHHDAWTAVLEVVAHAHGLGPAPRDTLGLDAWREPDAAEHLARVYETERPGRREDGVHYTPPTLVDWLLDRALTTDEPEILDPACGTGHVLLAAARRLGSAAITRLHGVDLDPVAVAIARLRLRLAAPDADPARIEANIRVGDGLDLHPAGPFDAVVGNPPFGGQLRSGTARASTSGLAPYTDLAAVFLHRALDQVRDGGRIALVQPLSVLAARDAAPVRAAMRERAAVVAFWSSPTPVFPDTSVLTCVPVVQLGACQDDVATWHGPDFRVGADRALPDAEWGALAARPEDPPVRPIRTRRTLADVAEVTADFRDQYYGLVPHVREDDGTPAARLITSGLIDPAHCRWGRTPTRFAKQRWAAPVVDLDSLGRSDLARWATGRLVPKLLVATQGRVIEAVVDPEGSWLPSVPVVTVTAADPELLWRLLAVCCAPPVTAEAALRYRGTALSASALKLSAAQIAALPLPDDDAAWDAAAVHAHAAQETSDAAVRADHLRACAAAMCRAYGDDGALAWWLDRAPGVSPFPVPRSTGENRP